MGKYNFKLDLDDNDTNPKIIALIKEKSRVLEFGSANGRLTRYLKEEKGCIVDIVEIDELAGREAAVYSNIACIGPVEGNIESFRWCYNLKSEKYDYVIFADVLEHLHCPIEVINKAREFLNGSGMIITSIPNISHNVIINNLLNDSFEYKNTGLLDDTHLRFFTRSSFEKMVKSLDLQITLVDCVIKELDQTEYSIDSSVILNERRKTLFNHKEGNIYQYIFVITEKVNHRALEAMIKPMSEPHINKFYFIKCFWTEVEGKEFSEDRSKVFWIDPSKSVFSLKFSQSMYISDLRIDILNCNCKVKILRIYLLKGRDRIRKNFVSNCSDQTESIYVFLHDFPQLMISDINDYINGVIIEMEYLLFDENISCELISELDGYKSVKEKQIYEKIRKLQYSKEELQEELLQVKKEIIKKQEGINELEQNLEKYLQFYNTVTHLKIWRLIKIFYKDCFSNIFN